MSRQGLSYYDRKMELMSGYGSSGLAGPTTQMGGLLTCKLKL